MTAALLDRATTRTPATRPTRRPAQPKLRVLDQAASRRRARHRSALLSLFVAVLAGFFAVAFVHAELVAGQQELDAVRTEISQAEARHAELARAVEEASAPAVIVSRATELGMVRARQPIYLAAAAPIRDVDVGPSLLTPAMATDGVDDASIVQVASGAESEAAPDDGGRLRGTLGGAGGISAAVRIDTTPAVAIAADPSPAGTTADAGSTPTAPVVTTTPEVATPSGPVSSVAGTRAVSTPAAAVAAEPSAAAASVVSSVPSSVAGSVTDTNPAGGLASAAATTSG